MLLSELLGAEVVTTDGTALGRVHDVLLVQDGPVGTNLSAALRVHALALGSRTWGTKLGYAQGTVQGPWLLRRLLAREPRLVPWESIVERDAGQIVVDPALAHGPTPSA